jgi:hypothetical protein
VTATVTDAPIPIAITYDPAQLTGKLVLQGTPENSIWDRLQQAAVNAGTEYSLQGNTIELPWPAILGLIREFGRQQKTLNFRFRPAEGEAKQRIDEFVQQFRRVRKRVASSRL